MIRLLLEPLDVWLFRDGRPFTAGADYHARSLFPPSPRTLYGALRTKMLFDAVERGEGSLTDAAFVERVVGAPKDFERLTLRGPLLAKREPDGQIVRYYPAPANLVQVGAAWQLLAPEPEAARYLGLISDDDLDLPWVVSRERPVGIQGGWLAERDFFATLQGEPRPATPADALYTIETRSGIGMERSGADAGPRVTREGRLFAISFVRPKPDVGLCLDVEGLNGLGAVGVLGLGGEGRAARYEVRPTKEPDRREARERVVAAGRLTVVLATPALFGNGWLPTWVDGATRATTETVRGLRLVAAAVGRPEPIGGFDVRAGRPRDISRAVPAGSVYWFEETETGAAGRAFDTLDGRAIADEGPMIGFGLCYVGVW